MRGIAKPLPSPEYLNSILHYNPETGSLIWKNGRGNRKELSVAGTTTPQGYRRIRIDGTIHMAHRIAFKMFWGLEPIEIDHINRCGLDNWIDNLRASTALKNMWNKSGTKGCYQHRDKWRAQIAIDGKNTYLGVFDTEQEAIDCYQAVKKVVHPQV